MGTAQKPKLTTIDVVKLSGQKAWRYAGSALLVGLSLGALKLFPRMTDASIALLLLLSVFLSAWLWESGPGVLAAALATLGLNYFVLPPLHTFLIEGEQNVAALVVFLISGLLIGRLSAIGRERLRLVEAERADLASLTQLSQAFFSDTLDDSLIQVAAERLRVALQSRHVSILLAGPDGTLSPEIPAPAGNPDEGLAQRALRLELTRFRGHPQTWGEGVRDAKESCGVPGGVSASDGGAGPVRA